MDYDTIACIMTVLTSHQHAQNVRQQALLFMCTVSITSLTIQKRLLKADIHHYLIQQLFSTMNDPHHGAHTGLLYRMTDTHMQLYHARSITHTYSPAVCSLCVLMYSCACPL